MKRCILHILILGTLNTGCRTGGKKALVNTSGKKIFQRMELENILVGKPEYLVIEYLGEPDDNPNQDLYHLDESEYIYYQRSYQSDPEQLDNEVVIFLAARGFGYALA